MPERAGPGDAVRAWVRAAGERLGGIDVVVSNASALGGPPDTIEKWRKVFEVNVWGSLQLTQAAVPALRARGGGSVVFVNSMSARKIRERTRLSFAPRGGPPADDDDGY